MKPHVRVLACGGTIASTDSDAGAAPTKRGDELVAEVPQLDDHATIEVEEIASKPGFDMDFEILRSVARSARSADRSDVDAIVVTHGTDTMEETAYYLDLVFDGGPPIVCTGSQRRPDEVSSDAPANLLAAVRAATDDRLLDAGGAYVAFNDELHAARTVTKTHTSKLETFRSPGVGPVALLTRHGIRYHRDPGSRSATLPNVEIDATVEMVKTGTGVVGRQVECAIEAGVEGIVVEGTGLGNVTGPLGETVRDAVAADATVVVTTRCHAGPVAAVYGTEGGGETLRRHGVIPGGALPAHKARIKLLLALSATDDPNRIRGWFDRENDAWK